MFSIIASVGKNNEIGKKGELVFHLKEDMEFFRKTTKNHTVVMGLNTWLSLPGKLKNRKNIVICEKEVLLKITKIPLKKYSLSAGVSFTKSFFRMPKLFI